MQRSSERVATFVLAQPGAAAFFAPVLPRLRAQGWRCEVNPETQPADADVVVTSTSYTASERDAVRWARAGRVPSVQLVDSWYDYRQRVELTNGADVVPNQIWVFDEDARAEAVKEGLPESRLRAVGNPVWEDVVVLPDAPVSNILLVDQPIGEDLGRRLGYDESDFFGAIARWLREEGTGGVNLWLAPHPRRAGCLPDCGDGVRVTPDAREALRVCGTVIGMFSSLLVDAFLAGRRVVSLQPGGDRADYCILSRLGLIPRVTQGSGLAAALAASRPGPRDFGLRFSQSCERVSIALTEMVQSRR